MTRTVELSIIIVNYNVRYYLENCLRSVESALSGLDAEVIVLDNASTDGSAEMMQTHFPHIRYEYLHENLGFSKTNNIGIAMSKGEFVLLLNPDTVIAEDTLSVSIKFMRSHKDCGALGVRMVDGSGVFLPESKRALPTPDVAFYKMFGLSTVFPRSRTFGAYHLGHLSEHETHSIEVLSGAYMFMRKEALDKVGVLDEQYFMYGEDIDLSWRIVKGGYKNYYVPETTIVHYKGESTKKGSLNYVKVFYKAMSIFARKHFTTRQASLFSLLINGAIIFRATLAALSRLIGLSWQIVFDFALVWLLFHFAANVYEDLGNKDFSMPFVSVSIAFYSLIVCITLLYSGSYDQPFRYARYVKGWGIATLILLGAYALLPEALRFSRAVVVLAPLMAFVAGLMWRFLASSFSPNGFKINEKRNDRKLIVAERENFESISSVIRSHGQRPTFMAGVTPYHGQQPEHFLCDIDKIEPAVQEFDIFEVVLSASDLSSATCIKLIQRLSAIGAEVKIAHPESGFYIGANDLVKRPPFEAGAKLNEFNISAYKRMKRTADLAVNCILLFASPFWMLSVSNLSQAWKNLGSVTIGRKSWVGLDPRGLPGEFPPLKPSIMHPMEHVIWPEDNKESAYNANVEYVTNYFFTQDIRTVLRNWHALGR